ncbi:MAG: hypothetical protein KF819_29820 [Labilithrix sp.]|nr:hypothetical protein [Labilithrix sp.]
MFAAAALAGCGLESSIVGGRCVPGLVLVGGECVQPSPTIITPTDPAEEPIVSLIGKVDGGAPTPTPIAPPFVEPLPPFPFDPAQPFIPLVPEEDAGPPELQCTAPLVACHGECIPVDSDAQNCGACGKICPSNICVAGECQGATPGDVVLIGHDFAGASSATAQAKVLANALSIPTTDPIRVLSFDGNATASTETESLAAAGIKGRAVQFTHAASATALTSSTLSQRFDVVLIHDAGSGDPAARGASWASSLGTFAQKGGVIVAVDTGSSPLPEVLSSAGLLTVASHTVLPLGTHLVVAAPADVVGTQVLSPYATTNAPVAFHGVTAESADVRWVVRKSELGGGDPVVVHRVVR